MPGKDLDFISLAQFQQGSTRPRGMLVIRKLETVTAAATVPTAATGKPAATAPAVVFSQPLVATEKPAD